MDDKNENKITTGELLFVFFISNRLFLQWVKPESKVTLLISFEANAKAILEEYEQGQYSYKLNILYTQQSTLLLPRASRM